MLTNPASLNDLTSGIIGAAIRVHQDKGPGLLESTYVECLMLELRERGLTMARKLPVPLTYRGRNPQTTYELNLLVEGVVIVEVKAVASLSLIHSAQVLMYLKLTGLPMGLLINFNVPVLTQGIRRLINSAPAANPVVI